MEQTRFKYSMKNIPIPSRNSYLKKLIEKTESIIKPTRWKAFFFENSECNEDDSNTNSPPQNEDLNKFEADVYNMIKNIEFRHIRDDFQDQLQEDIKKINNSTKAFIPADKTANYYQIEKLRTTSYSLIT